MENASQHNWSEVPDPIEDYQHTQPTTFNDIVMALLYAAKKIEFRAGEDAITMEAALTHTKKLLGEDSCWQGSLNEAIQIMWEHTPE